MAKAITSTEFSFPSQKGVYHGKVRDVYNIDDKFLLMVVTDRISAFDVVLPEGIPYKGQVLNQIASMFLEMVSDIVPVWNIGVRIQCNVGVRCQPYPVEMIVSGYLTGSSWRRY
jgi:phosphoribosylaminoimidazole-succinocarboxamide synthase